MRIEGIVDRVDVDSVGGWAFAEDHPQDDVIVDIFKGGTYIASVPANMPGEDLQLAGKARTNCRFIFWFHEKLTTSALADIRVVTRQGGITLGGGVANTIDYARRAYSVPELHQPYYHVITTGVRREAGGDLVVELFCDIYLDPELYDEGRVMVKGAKSSSYDYGLPTRGLAKDFWFWPNTRHLGIRVEAVVTPPEDDLVIATLRFRDRRSTEMIEIPIVAIPVNGLARISREKMPEQALIERVLGPTADPWHGYVVGGWSNAVQLDWMSRKYSGKGLAECKAILDWGCGCARNTRPIMQLAGPEVDVIGVDVDMSNIAWSQTHFGAEHFIHSQYNPPLSLDRNSFDIVYGLSIFTHLTELAQDMWLSEIRDVLRPGGLAILTYHGEASAYSRPFSLEDIGNYKIRGIEDSVSDEALRDVGDDMNYYRSTFHTTSYLRQRWGRFLEVLGVEIAGGGHQWFAVCRKR